MSSSYVGLGLQEVQVLPSVRTRLHTHCATKIKKRCQPGIGEKKAYYLTTKETKSPTNTKYGSVSGAGGVEFPLAVQE